MHKKKLPIPLIIIVILIATNIFFFLKSRNYFNNQLINQKITNGKSPQDLAQKAKPAPTSLPTPVPSPKPLTFEELNALYGPCVNLPVLFYHHIQNMDVANAAGQQNLTVATNIFIEQMQYLKSNGYNPTATNTITDFFDRGIVPPTKSVLLTFDDGYVDFYVNVLPIMRQMGFKSIMALPTGLVGNPGYLSWDQLTEAASSGVEIVNHSWSHQNMDISNTAIIEKEITTADSQLTSRGYNPNKIFVYPYGATSDYAINFLQNHGYTLGFTTVPGSTLCKGRRLTLPRIRIGNTSLSAYGF